MRDYILMRVSILCWHIGFMSAWRYLAAKRLSYALKDLGIDAE